MTINCLARQCNYCKYNLTSHTVYYCKHHQIISSHALLWTADKWSDFTRFSLRWIRKAELTGLPEFHDSSRTLVSFNDFSGPKISIFKHNGKLFDDHKIKTTFWTLPRVLSTKPWRSIVPVNKAVMKVDRTISLLQYTVLSYSSITLHMMPHLTQVLILVSKQSTHQRQSHIH